MAEIVLHLLNPEKYLQDVMKILKKKNDQKVIYVTTNKPYDFLVNSFKKKGIRADNVFFIDCISMHLKKDVKDKDNCVFIESPQNLTSISIAISESVKNIPGKKMLFFDSLSILLVYNDANTLLKFSNFLMNKMRDSDVDTIMIALESDMDKDIIKQIESISDKIKRGG